MTHASTAEQAPETIPARICQEPGCGKPLRSDNKSDYCTQHHHAKNRPSVEQKVCQEPGCGRPLRSDNTTGYCEKHVLIKNRPSVEQNFCQGCGAQLRHDNHTGYCQDCRSRPRPPQRCIGWVTDANHILVQCPEVFTPTHGDKQYHSTECYERTFHRQQLDYHLGDIYVKGRHTKQHEPKLCQEGWTIRDHEIAKCDGIFTRGRPDKEYHSNLCHQQRLRWQKLGFKLGQSVLRTCAYRNCKKGEGGTRGTFDQIHRSLKSGDYFCDPRCNAAEKRARKEDSIAEKLAAAERKGWRPHDWENWDADQQSVGIQLIENPGIKPRALGRRLDDSRLPCI